jgi:ubiquinone/menaquinone biosynthesis C-methylase UbiE
VSDRYTHGHHESVLRSHRWRTVENSAAYLVPHLHPGQALLDVGCGPGTITRDFATRVAPGSVLGIDASAEVIEQARAEGPGPSFAVGDVYALDAADASYDVVHAHQVLQHLSDPVRALREMRRVAGPDGIVACRDSDYGAFVWAPHDARLDQWLSVYRAVARRNHAEPDAGRRLLQWAHDAGFAEVVYTTSTWTFADGETRAWWSELWADRCVHSAFAHQVVEYGVASAAELASFADGFRAWARHPAASFVVLHGEVIARG